MPVCGNGVSLTVCTQQVIAIWILEMLANERQANFRILHGLSPHRASLVALGMEEMIQPQPEHL